MTVKQYKHLNSLFEQYPDDTERLAYSVCYLYNLEEQEVNLMKPERFVKYCDRLQKELQIKSVSDKRFETDATKITAGQLLECLKWMETGPVEQLHKIAASILKKRGKHIEDSEQMLNEDIKAVYQSVMEFLTSFNSLFEKFKWLFAAPIDEDDKVKTTHPFIKNFGWVFSAKEVSNHLGITLNETFKISSVEFLNALVYLKSKGQYDKWVSKQKT